MKVQECIDLTTEVSRPTKEWVEDADAGRGCRCGWRVQEWVEDVGAACGCDHIAE
jgi:hypothetical protein